MSDPSRRPDPPMRQWTPAEVALLLERVELAEEDRRLGLTYSQEEVFRAARARLEERLRGQPPTPDDGDTLP